ncbi:MAG: hypothetical protein GX330_03790 [Bacteroidales bacterium]|nr:hypothetical protein [Bacteroidales bacterium]
MQTKFKEIISRIQRLYDFSKRERIAILIVAILLFALLSIQIMYTYLYIPQQTKQLPENVEEKINRFYSRQLFLKDSLANLRYAHRSNRISKKTPTLNPFPFNPNNLSEETWKKMGLSDRQIKIIKNYEEKGGKFYKKEDLKKIYGISELEYKQLEPFIFIPKTESKTKKDQSVSESPPIILDLNIIDSSDLLQIPFIYAKLASRIILYRDALGGFVNKEQLLEVYGIDSNRYQKINNYFIVHADNIHTININTATYGELIKHPYIDAYLTKTIIQLRKKKGSKISLEDLKKETRMYEELYNKLKPYLITK